MSKGIEGKVVLITGGSTGICAEVARLLAGRGAKIAVAARRKQKLDEMVSTIKESGGVAIRRGARRRRFWIAAALPRFVKHGSGHIINLSSVAGIKVFAPGGTVYSGTKFAVSAISEGLRQEVGEKIRVTSIEPGAVESELKYSTTGGAAETVMNFYRQAISAASVARAIAFAIEQPDDVDIKEIVIRPTAQEF